MLFSLFLFKGWKKFLLQLAAGLMAACMVISICNSEHRMISAVRKFDHRQEKHQGITHDAIYLITGAGPSEMEKHRHLVSATADFILLCYKEDCASLAADLGMQSHFYPNSSWTEARNYLLQMTQEKEKREKKNYLYYIFMDCDFVPSLSGPRVNATSSQPSQRKAWDHFEYLLKEYLPPLATPYAVQYSPIPFKDEEATSTLYLDAVVNAFHRDAVPLLLPYTTIFDKQSWWASQAVLVYRMRCVFGWVLQFNDVRWSPSHVNVHNPYPRGHVDFWKLASDAMGAYLPAELHEWLPPVPVLPRYGALSPAIIKKLDWKSAVLQSCRKITMLNMEHIGYSGGVEQDITSAQK